MNWAGWYRQKVWKLLQGKIKLEDPAPVKQYLGCTHRHHEGGLDQEIRVLGSWLPVPEFEEAMAKKAAHQIRCIEYDCRPPPNNALPPNWTSPVIR